MAGPSGALPTWPCVSLQPDAGLPWSPPPQGRTLRLREGGSPVTASRQDRKPEPCPELPSRRLRPPLRADEAAGTGGPWGTEGQCWRLRGDSPLRPGRWKDSPGGSGGWGRGTGRHIWDAVWAAASCRQRDWRSAGGALGPRPPCSHPPSPPLSTHPLSGRPGPSAVPSAMSPACPGSALCPQLLRGLPSLCRPAPLSPSPAPTACSLWEGRGAGSTQVTPPRVGLGHLCFPGSVPSPHAETLQAAGGVRLRGFQRLPCKKIGPTATQAGSESEGRGSTLQPPHPPEP